MKLRHEFVLKALEPFANIAALSREYGISRKTAYKWIKRFKEQGVVGLEDISRRPHGSPLRASGDVVLKILELRTQYPRWGPKKLRVVLERSVDEEEVPSVRTIARVLERAGLVTRRRKKPPLVGRPLDAPQVDCETPNDWWTVDFKGWWSSRDGARCEPLTVRDAASRYVLCAQLMESTRAGPVRAEFERTFDLNGLPKVIQVDNGSPFASTRARLGMTSLSAWWVSLGIRVVRGRPSHPEDNGGHERMHLDMRYDVEDVGASSVEAQQRRLDEWRHEFNHVRPHEALGQRVPADLYSRSPRRFCGPRLPSYPSHLVVRTVSTSGRCRYRGNLVRIGQGFRGYDVGIELVDQATIRVQFYELDLGTFPLLQKAS